MIPEQINQSISMRDIADKYNIQVNGAGYASCPFHKEDTPSLKIYNELGKGFYCYGCNTGGDVIKFVMKLFGISFPQALIRIANDFGLSAYSDTKELLEWQKRQRETARAKRAKESEDFKRFMSNAIKANKLRLEIIENNEAIDDWDPGKIGFISHAWADAIHKRDLLQYQWEEVIEVE